MIDFKDLKKIAKGDFWIEDYDPKTGGDICILIDEEKPIDLLQLEDWHIIQGGIAARFLLDENLEDGFVYVAEVGKRTFDDWFTWCLSGSDKDFVLKSAIQYYADEKIEEIRAKTDEIIMGSFKPSLQVA